jgi:hypothetical protein
VAQSVALLTLPVKGVTVQCLEYFTFVMEGAGRKWKRVVLKIKAKIDICNRLECGKRYILSIIF